MMHLFAFARDEVGIHRLQGLHMQECTDESQEMGIIKCLKNTEQTGALRQTILMAQQQAEEHGLNTLDG